MQYKSNSVHYTSREGISQSQNMTKSPKLVLGKGTPVLYCSCNSTEQFARVRASVGREQGCPLSSKVMRYL